VTLFRLDEKQANFQRKHKILILLRTVGSVYMRIFFSNPTIKEQTCIYLHNPATFLLDLTADRK